ncbi:MAG: DEAD/DEAH box helicase family protein [Desulfuromonadales bacterium]|nr:DEAD/DEAH box helicase family protein [Desulfuromonadales bacterium]
MAVLELLRFQQEAHDALAARFREVRTQYDRLGDNLADQDVIRKRSGAILLQAPTGSGKTLLACRLLATLSDEERIVWFWFAPFSGVIDQTRATIQAQSPTLPLLNLEVDRRLDGVRPGGVFVTTWQSVATSNKEGRKARISGDNGLALDDLFVAAREDGYRIGCVVDEAHHGFKKAAEAKRFFTETLQPDYTLMMTATPKDADAKAFARETGYQVGDEENWASVCRHDGVKSGLLKKGVKMVRFIVRNADDGKLVDFERTALRECSAMHRRIKETLAANGISLTPLMLVQVPNGGQHIDMARDYLIGTLGFAESSVRVHTASEPDSDLMSLANDPSVEVLIFKMAVALGFDAPRAWTLAAMRGARDASFGVQVVGRLMRRHRLLHGREVPPELEHGYVFLANSEAQEGLMEAGDLINRMPNQISELGSQTVVTIIAETPGVQVVRCGEPLRLFGSAPVPEVGVSAASATPAPLGSQGFLLDQADWLPVASNFTRETPMAGESRGSSLILALAADARREYQFPLREHAPQTLVTEKMPPLPDDFEEQVVAQIDFTTVLSDRDRVRTKVVQRTQDLFEPGEIIDEEMWASFSTEALAEKARQLVIQFDVDQYSFPRLLEERFRAALINQGIEPPQDDEQLLQQLDLVLVRNDRLIAEAIKRCRAAQLSTVEVALLPEIRSEFRLDPSKRNIYGVFPADLNNDERHFAELLDIDENVLWWHRNPSQQSSSVALYGWSLGKGFFPDFIVGVKDRKVGNGIALVEVKGPQLQYFERAKASAHHKIYGLAFMVGYNREKKDFVIFREEAGNLYENGRFETARLRWGN